MSYTKQEKPVVPTHEGPQQQLKDYKKISDGQHTAIRPTHRSQTKTAKGYVKPQPK